jgi:hypothetical protein
MSWTTSSRRLAVEVGPLQQEHDDINRSFNRLSGDGRFLVFSRNNGKGPVEMAFFLIRPVFTGKAPAIFNLFAGFNRL